MASFKALLGQNGVEVMLPLEVYDPISSSWSSLYWSALVGPVPTNGTTFLFRYQGLTGLYGFKDTSSAAHKRLPNHKGKGRA